VSGAGTVLIFVPALLHPHLWDYFLGADAYRGWQC
jgi:hypothetical protein